MIMTKHLDRVDRVDKVPKLSCPHETRSISHKDRVDKVDRVFRGSPTRNFSQQKKNEVWLMVPQKIW